MSIHSYKNKSSLQPYCYTADCSLTHLLHTHWYLLDIWCHGIDGIYPVKEEMHFCGYHWVWQTDLLYDVLSILFNNKLGKFILLCLDSTSTFYCWSPFIMPKRICMHGSFNLPHTNKVCAQLLLRRILRTCANLVPLRTGTCYIRDNLCCFYKVIVLQELQMKWIPLQQ